MKCPHCHRDIRESVIVSANAAIVAKRRKRRGNQMTSEQARQRQVKSVAARKARKARDRVNANNKDTLAWDTEGAETLTCTECGTCFDSDTGDVVTANDNGAFVDDPSGHGEG